MKLDGTSETRLLFLYPGFAESVRKIIDRMHLEFGFEMKITETVRTFERQRKLYSQGRDTIGPIITRARTGLSLHHYGLAADVCFQGSDPYLDRGLMKAWDDLGLCTVGFDVRWGGRFAFADKPHIEARYPVPLEQIISEYKIGGIPGVWATIDKVRGVPVGRGWHDLGATARLMNPGTLSEGEASVYG